MVTRKLLLAACLAAGAGPAFAAITVVGSNAAQMCYQAADSRSTPTFRDLRYCDEAFREGALAGHDRVATHVNRGIVRMRRDLMAEAIADFDAAIALNPNQAEAYVNKGGALMRLDNPAEAVGLFTVALSHNPRRPAIAHYGRGVANEQLGNVAAAYRDYRRASELDPDWAEPRTELTRFRLVGQR